MNLMTRYFILEGMNSSLKILFEIIVYRYVNYLSIYEKLKLLNYIFIENFNSQIEKLNKMNYRVYVETLFFVS